MRFLIRIFCVLVATWVVFSVDAAASGHRLGAFGAYDVDAHGDVTFRYVGTFVRIIVNRGLPDLHCVPPPCDNRYRPDPMAWDRQDLGQQGRWHFLKLLVPRRYQDWYRGYYWLSIQRNLILEARY